MRKGDWVQVWGQVAQTADEPLPGVHPEDVVVEFFSHNEQWEGHVRLDRVSEPDTLPEFVRRCTALRETKKGGLMRCIGHERHAGHHEDRKGVVWDDTFTIGYFEER